MWMFTPLGFFSAVQVREEHAEKLELPKANAPWVMVRTRVYGDAVNLLALWYELHPRAMRGHGLLVSGEPEEIIQWPGRDYPYRLIMPRVHWVELAGELAARIDYPNFKNRVTQIQGEPRHNLYSRVWSVMYGAERWLEAEEVKIRERERYFRENPPLPFDGDSDLDAFDDEDDSAFGFLSRSYGTEFIKRGRRRGRRGKKKKN